MAEGDGALYNTFKGEVLSGELPIVADSIRIALMTGYTPDIDVHQGWDQISGEECVDASYPIGGVTISGESITVDIDNDRAYYDGSDVVFEALGPLGAGDPDYAVLYDFDHPFKCLMGYWEIASATNGGNYTLQFSSNGIVVLT